MNPYNFSKENLIGLTKEEAKRGLEQLYPDKDIYYLTDKTTVPALYVYNRIQVFLNDKGYITYISEG